ncbi:asparagine synthase (glutamine-hydrolyzing) [Polyangium spumosum]|uniref:asparagine synthase (glutamine-hydrolyzing) n=1 Tax=Polyangium spumosum TaxID=889282 RepID=A0A6N7PKR9_9BACT|nr:asparagine synthase (glutamine-hydrolyzing) [Polyangium spumosum]MRG92377.1 asparagine synthase (glutamine-hydrolyzing) [Polyangium spumosum]
MCGILGAFSVDQPFATPPIPANSLERMRHRGPDAQGWYVDDHAILGFRRLAILDLVGGGQPLYSEDEQIVVVVNGEIYNHHALRETLKARHRFRTRVDGEVLIHLYEERGIEFVNELSGMFAFALYDRAKRRLILGRDRPGLKPLFYRWSDGVLHFASEMKPLLHDRKPAVCREAVSDYLRFGYVPAPLTILDGVNKLPAGSVLVVQPDTAPRTIPYWKLRFEHDDRKTSSPSQLGKWEEELRHTLQNAVQARLESEVPMGFLLSGGVDSASVFALGASALRDRKVQAFTIGFRGAAIDESEAAGEVASRYQAEHRVIHLDRDDSMSLDDILYSVEEPVSTDALLPTACVFGAVARANITTVLSGEGSDELFAGYRKFAVATRDPAAKDLSPLERYLLHEEFVFPSRAEREALLGESVSDSRFSELEREAQELDPLSQMLLIETRMRLPDRINLRLDRTSMAQSIEARAPFMEHKVMEFAARIPHVFRTGPTFNKYLLRHAMRDHLPSVVLDARKAPFHAPDTWFTNHRDSDALLGRDAVAEAGLVRPEPVQALRERARGGDRAAQEKLFSLFVLHAWHRAFYRR